MNNKGLWPEIINNYHVYKGNGSGIGDILLGLGDELTLPSLEKITETLSGSGILGEVEAENPGHFGTIDMTIPYVAACEGMFDYDESQRTYLTIRSTQQSTIKASGEKTYSGIKLIVGGSVKGINLGKLKASTQSDSSVTLGVTYIKIDIRYEDGTSVTALELDKFNEVYIKNGVDQLARIKAFD